MGFWDGLDTEKYDRHYSDRFLVKRILDYLHPHISQIVIISIMVLLSATMSGLTPILVSRSLDSFKSSNTSDLSTSILFICGLIALIGVLSWFGNWIRRRLSSAVVADAATKLAADAFEASQSHDLSFFDENSSGRVVSRITSDTRDYGQLVLLITDISALFFEAFIVTLVMFITNWQMSLLLFGFMPLVFFLAVGFRKLARKVTSDGMRAVANVNASIKENISGISVAKNFRQEMNIYLDFKEANQTSFLYNLKRGLVLSLVIPSVNGFWGIIYGLLIYTGGLNLTNGLITLGGWGLFILAQDRFIFPILDLSSYWSNIQAGLAATERIFALIDTPQSVQQTGHFAIPPIKGKIKFRNVNFRYKNEEPVLSDFSITISPGENLAIVGHTGAGKSSIARLIARFYEFQSGLITIDDFDIRTLDLNEYRRQLGIVTQSPFLFDGTVGDNIRYGCQVCDDQTILQMANQIGDGEWLSTLPDGLNTRVGERGIFLSLGQRQLVSLMRVLIQKPAIFILDEATASIDPFTEWQIQQGLRMILSQTTSILIAHRLSTVKSVDRIIVLESGKIIEEGSHTVLLDKGGHYASLYQTYFRHQSLDYIEQSKKMVSSI